MKERGGEECEASVHFDMGSNNLYRVTDTKYKGKQ